MGSQTRSTLNLVGCNPDGAEIALDNILDRLTG
jgi:hypothetical protein